MSNITIALDESLLRSARIKAVQAGTTVNAVLREKLREFVGETSVEPDHMKGMRQFIAMARKSKGNSQGRKWTREDAYQRGGSD